MKKPIVFFSHSAADKDSLGRLKELFVQKTGGAIDVFLSSDGQSIRLGTNWVGAIEDALNKANLMLVFVTPNSLRSHWLYFESGYAYSKGIQTIPIGFKGVDIAKLPEPLSHIQAFNITSSDGLNNIIHEVNKCLGHTHPLGFTLNEYREVVALGGTADDSAFGNLGNYVRSIIWAESDVANLNFGPSDWLVKLQEALQVKGIRSQKRGNELVFEGVSAFHRPNYAPATILFDVDPYLFHVTAPIIAYLMSFLRKDGVKGSELCISFSSKTILETEAHRIAARLHGSPARLDDARDFLFRKIGFRIEERDFVSIAGYIRTHLTLRLAEDSIPSEDIRELLMILLANHVIRLLNDDGSWT